MAISDPSLPGVGLNLPTRDGAGSPHSWITTRPHSIGDPPVASTQTPIALSTNAVYNLEPAFRHQFPPNYRSPSSAEPRTRYDRDVPRFPPIHSDHRTTPMVPSGPISKKSSTHCHERVALNCPIHRVPRPSYDPSVLKTSPASQRLDVSTKDRRRSLGTASTAL